MVESMKDFEKEIEESFKNRKQYDDPDASKWEVFEKYLAEKTVHRVKITEVVKGGCVAFLDEVRGFIPASQLSDAYVEDLEVYQNKNIDVVVITADAENKKLVLSHREIERQEKEAKKQENLAKISVGDVITGKVESLKDYGAFIELGEGLSGLLHISQISHKRIKHPGVVLKVGDSLELKVIGMENGKISLSKKVLEPEVGVLEAEAEEQVDFDYDKGGEATTSLASLLSGFTFNE